MKEFILPITRIISTLVKVLFGIFGVIRICSLKKKRYDYSKNTRWTNMFFIKFSATFFILVIYGLETFLYFINSNKFIDFAFSKFYCPILPCISFTINIIIWFFAAFLLYYEFTKQKTQTWLTLRGLWVANGIIIIIEVVFKWINKADFIKNFNNQVSVKLSIILETIIAFLSALLMLFAVLFQYDNFLPQSVNNAGLITRDESENQYSIFNFNNKAYIKNSSSSYFPKKITIGDDEDNKFTIEIRMEEEPTNFNSPQYYSPLIPESFLTESSDKMVNDLMIIIEMTIVRHKTNSHEVNRVMKSINALLQFTQKVNMNFKTKASLYSDNNIENNDDFKMAKSYLQQSYNILLSITNARNEENMNLGRGIRILEQMFIRLMKLSPFFILKLIEFLEVKADDLIGHLKNEDFGNFQESLASSELKKNFTTEDEFEEKLDSENLSFLSEVIRNDNNKGKINAFINAVITHYEYIKAKIVNINIEEKKIIVEIKIKDELQMIKKEFTLKSFEELLKQEKHYFQCDWKNGVNKIAIIMKYLKQNSKIEQINKEKFEESITHLINDLFYYNETLIAFFDIDKFISTTQFDLKYISSFFSEVNNSIINEINEDINQYEPIIENDIRTYTILCTNDNEEQIIINSDINLESNKENSLVIQFVITAQSQSQTQNQNPLKWKCEIALGDLYYALKEIIENKRVAQFLKGIYSLVKNITSQLEVLFKLADFDISSIDYNQFNKNLNDIENNFNIEEEKENKIKIQLRKIAEEIKKLFYQVNMPIFSSEKLRRIFKFENFSEQENFFFK